MQDLGETFTSSSSPRMSPLQVSIPSSMAAAAASMMRPEVSLLCRGWRSPSQKTPLWLIHGLLGGSPASKGPLEVPLLLELEPLPPPEHHLSLFQLYFSLWKGHTFFSSPHKHQETFRIDFFHLVWSSSSVLLSWADNFFTVWSVHFWLDCKKKQIK